MRILIEGPRKQYSPIGEQGKRRFVRNDER